MSTFSGSTCNSNDYEDITKYCGDIYAEVGEKNFDAVMLAKKGFMDESQYVPMASISGSLAHLNMIPGPTVAPPTYSYNPPYTVALNAIAPPIYSTVAPATNNVTQRVAPPIYNTLVPADEDANDDSPMYNTLVPANDTDDNNDSPTYNTAVPVADTVAVNTATSANIVSPTYSTIVPTSNTVVQVATNTAPPSDAANSHTAASPNTVAPDTLAHPLLTSE